jgi:D-isomer specific 2-hydroxyacid dehydrogenase, NAD binding domain
VPLMNSFYKHHRDSIRWHYRRFDRILLNGLIQPFQLKDKKIAGVAIDVLDQEPLPLDHPFRSAPPNLLATPHIGYVSRGLYARFYRDTVANNCRWLDGRAAGWRVFQP